VSRFREEIGQQPEVARRLLEQAQRPLEAIGEGWREKRPAGFVIAARGSSDHAALYAKYLFGSRNRLLVALAAPSLFTHYRTPPDLTGQCVIGISQSGASPDVVAVLEEARRQGCPTLAVTNEADSRLAASADLLLPLGAGTESSVPASKTYTASLLALALLSQALDPDPSFAAALAQVPAAIDAALSREADLDRLAPVLRGPRAVVLGRGFNLSTAEEVALKLTETSYLLARAWSVADFEHGPIAVVERGFPVLLIGAPGPVDADLAGIGTRLLEYSCRVLGLFDGGRAPIQPDSAVTIDSGLPEELTPLPLAVLGQLLSHRLALALGIDPDRPRALQKVTRTW